MTTQVMPIAIILLGFGLDLHLFFEPMLESLESLWPLPLPSLASSAVTCLANGWASTWGRPWPWVQEEQSVETVRVSP